MLPVVGSVIETPTSRPYKKRTTTVAKFRVGQDPAIDVPYEVSMSRPRWFDEYGEAVTDPDLIARLEAKIAKEQHDHVAVEEGHSGAGS